MDNRQLSLPGIPAPDWRLLELAAAQRALLEAYERYEQLRAEVFRHDNPHRSCA
jgi:hypothetical protein